MQSAIALHNRKVKKFEIKNEIKISAQNTTGNIYI